MRKTIKFTGMDSTSQMTDYLERKIDSLDRLIDSADTSVLAQVEVGKITEHHNKGEIFRAEINLHIAGNDFRVECTADTLYSAIDLAREQLYHELQSHKRRKISLMRRSGAKIKSLLKGFYGKGDKNV